MNNGTSIKSFNAHGGGVSAMDYTREGNIVTVGRDKLVRLWDGNGAKKKDYGGLKDIGMEVAYDAETKRVFGGDWTGLILAWNSEDAAKVGEVKHPILHLFLPCWLHLKPQLAKAKS